MDTVKIGEAAGKIWQQLGKRGQIPLTTLAKSVGTESPLAQLAVGWLAREGKVRIQRKGNSYVVALTEDEARLFAEQR